jgi:2-oxoglutarate ferredoxin oxidoreductase subunit beta
VIHDETDPVLAFLLSTLRPPQFPTPIGVFRAVTRPTYESIVVHQIHSAKQRHGAGDLDELLNRGDTWTVG